jgi:hypothetical protein
VNRRSSCWPSRGPQCASLCSFVNARRGLPGRWPPRTVIGNLLAQGCHVCITPSQEVGEQAHGLRVVDQRPGQPPCGPPLLKALDDGAEGQERTNRPTPLGTKPGHNRSQRYPIWVMRLTPTTDYTVHPYPDGEPRVTERRRALHAANAYAYGSGQRGHQGWEPWPDGAVHTGGDERRGLVLHYR